MSEQLARQARRRLEKEESLWKNKGLPETEKLEDEFFTRLFDEKTEDYGSLFRDFARQYQSFVRKWNHKLRVLQLDEMFFFKQYFPIETPV